MNYWIPLILYTKNTKTFKYKNISKFTYIVYYKALMYFL